MNRPRPNTRSSNRPTDRPQATPTATAAAIDDAPVESQLSPALIFPSLPGEVLARAADILESTAQMDPRVSPRDGDAFRLLALHLRAIGEQS